MPIKVECEICGARYRVGDHRAGRTIPCKECGAGMRVPAGGGSGPPKNRRSAGSSGTIPLARPRPVRPDAADDDEDFADFDDDDPSNATLWMALGVGGVAALGLGIILVASLSGRDQPAANPDALAQNSGAPDAGVNPFDSPPRPPTPRVPATRPSTPNPAPGGNATPDARRPQNPLPQFGNNRPPGLPGNNQPFAGRNVPGRVPANPPPAQFGDGRPLGGLPFGGVAGGGLPGAVPAEWSAQPDPPDQPVQFEDSRRIQIDLPAGAGVTDVTFPSSYGPFAALGKMDERQPIEVWNLQNRSRFGRVGGVRLVFPRMALSSDGKYFAAAASNADRVLVWDVRQSRSLVELPLAGSGPTDVLEFAGSARVIAARRLSQDKTLYIWSLPGGQAERALELPDAPVKESLAASPGGRYLALFAGRLNATSLRLYDLTTGEVAGQVAPPAVEPGSPRCQGLEFSPDGSELAGLFDAGRGTQIRVWSMTDGRLVEQIELERLPWVFSRHHGRPLQWFPNGQRWLVHGTRIVDRGTKNIIFSFPEDRSDRSPRHVLDDARITMVTGERNRGAVTTFELSEELLDKARE